MIACSMESHLYMLGNDPAQEDFAGVPQSMLDAVQSPLAPSAVTFEQISKALRISEASATILDDVRFLTQLISSRKPRSDDRIRSTATWLSSRLDSISRSAGPQGHPQDETDHIQDAVHAAAIIYSWAISSAKPMSHFNDTTTRHGLFVSTQAVSLATWEKIPGIYLWIMLVACSGALPDMMGRFMRRKVSVAAAAIAFDDFPLATTMLRSFWLIQRWIADQ